MAILARMRRVSITELKNKLSQYLRLVKQGETVEILERSIPVAEIRAVRRGQGEGGAQLRPLIREGVVSEAKAKPGKNLWRKPPVRCKGDAVTVLIEERGGL